jgi:hypothetical protein
MRKWGIVISVFYALILLGLIVPAVIFFSGAKLNGCSGFLSGVRDTYQELFFWVPAGAILASQTLLLFLSVDTSQKRLKPRTHILVSVAVGALLIALLTSALVWSLGFAIRGDKFWGSFFDKQSNILLFWGTAWLLWAILFYFYFRNSSAVVTRLTSWLLKGAFWSSSSPSHAMSSSAVVTIVPRRSPPASASPPASPSCSCPLGPASSSSTKNALMPTRPVQSRSPDAPARVWLLDARRIVFAFCSAGLQLALSCLTYNLTLGAVQYKYLPRSLHELAMHPSATPEAALALSAPLCPVLSLPATARPSRR